MQYQQLSLVMNQMSGESQYLSQNLELADPNGHFEPKRKIKVNTLVKKDILGYRYGIKIVYHYNCSSSLARNSTFQSSLSNNAASTVQYNTLYDTYILCFEQRLFRFIKIPQLQNIFITTSGNLT